MGFRGIRRGEWGTVVGSGSAMWGRRAWRRVLGRGCGVRRGRGSCIGMHDHWMGRGCFLQIDWLDDRRWIDEAVPAGRGDSWLRSVCHGMHYTAMQSKVQHHTSMRTRALLLSLSLPPSLERNTPQPPPTAPRDPVYCMRAPPPILNAGPERRAPCPSSPFSGCAQRRARRRRRAGPTP